MHAYAYAPPLRCRLINSQSCRTSNARPFPQKWHYLEMKHNAAQLALPLETLYSLCSASTTGCTLRETHLSPRHTTHFHQAHHDHHDHHQNPTPEFVICRTKPTLDPRRNRSVPSSLHKPRHPQLRHTPLRETLAPASSIPPSAQAYTRPAASRCRVGMDGTHAMPTQVSI